MRVLVAEDERLLADTVAEGLRRRSMAVDVCYDGDAALERVRVHRYDVVILDRDLPRVHGDEVCKRIVAAGGEPRVLMLTAAAGIRDRVDGLDIGADDYLTKPFAFAELIARVRSLGRRARPALPPVLERAGITLDLPRHRAWRDGCSATRWVGMSASRWVGMTGDGKGPAGGTGGALWCSGCRGGGRVVVVSRSRG